MSNFVISQPPDSFEDESKRYLNEMQKRIDFVFDTVHKFAPRFDLPSKPQDGQIYYFGDAVLPEILWPGFWGYEEGNWTYLGGTQAVQSAYGGIQTDGVVAMPDLTAIWYKVLEFTVETVIPAKGVIQDTVNSELVLPFKGVYSFNSTLAFVHNEVNAGRVILARLLNSSSGVTTDPFPVGTGRNTAVTNMDIAAMFLQVTDNSLLNDISLEISSPDGYLNVTMQGSINCFMISEIQI